MSTSEGKVRAMGGHCFAADTHSELGQLLVLASAVQKGKPQVRLMVLHVFRKASPYDTADKPN
jgi:hypothetical protein